MTDSAYPNDPAGRPSSAEQRTVVRPAESGKPGFQLVASRGFEEWLAGERMSLALTTYQVGALLLLGLKANREISIYAAAFDRSMGLWCDGQIMYWSSKLSSGRH